LRNVVVIGRVKMRRWSGAPHAAIDFDPLPSSVTLTAPVKTADIPDSVAIASAVPESATVAT